MKRHDIWGSAQWRMTHFCEKQVRITNSIKTCRITVFPHENKVQLIVIRKKLAYGENSLSNDWT